MSLISPHIKTILFDWDDTLVLTAQPKFAQHKFIAKQYYNLELSDDEIASHWGEPFEQLVGILYRTDDIATGMAHNRNHRHDFPKVKIDSMPATLQKLKDDGYKIGVITATSRFFLDDSMAEMAVGHLFDYTQAHEDSQKHKPHPAVFEPTKGWLKSHSISATETVYVGDGLHDMHAAVGAGFDFIGTLTGMTTAGQFEKHSATYIDDITDLTA